ncbi:MAG: glycosyltransferase family 4 protein [candidate division WOR-3 bacterium]
MSAAYRPYPSGVSEHVHGLALGLCELGQDVTILTTRFAGSEFGAGPIPVVRLGRAVLVPMNRSYATLPVGLNLVGQVRRFFAENRFDIVHCHGMFWPEISYWAMRYSGAVNVFTNLTAGFRTSTVGAGLFRRLFRRQLARIHGRIAISARSRLAVEAYVPGDYRIIPCGVDLKRFRPKYGPVQERTDGGHTLLFVGRLDRRKGLGVLLSAMPRVLEQVPDARLVVVGAGPTERAARRFVIGAGLESFVTFAGRVGPDELPGYYSSCDVYCSPAIGGETFGIVLLEAMASGAPVVASNIPGYDEVIADGVDGLMFPAGDVEALSEVLARILLDGGLRRQLAEAGLRKSSQFAWSNVARMTLEYYCELVDKSSARANTSA